MLSRDRRSPHVGSGVLPLVVACLVWPGVSAAERMRLVHADFFNPTSALDDAFWKVETGFFRNQEAQYYRPENVAIRNGVLRLEGRRERVANAAFDPKGRNWITTRDHADYTSGSIVTREAFTYGVFEVVARMPQGPGTWPAIWTVFEQGPPYREIDLVEAVGSAPGTAYTTIWAGPDLPRARKWTAETPVPNLDTSFHTYRLDWRPDTIAISIDGHLVLRVSPEEAHKDGVDPLRAKMRLRINLALGGKWAGAIDDTKLPASLEVKSIIVWRYEP